LFAVLETGGKQHKVQPGSVLRVEKLEVPQGAEVAFDRILAVGDEEQTVIGAPFVEGARVLAQVLQQGKAHKIIVFKYKAKKNYRRKAGHRQPFTEIRVREIICPGFTGGLADAGKSAGKAAPKKRQLPEQENEQPDNGEEVKKSARKTTTKAAAAAKTTAAEKPAAKKTADKKTAEKKPLERKAAEKKPAETTADRTKTGSRKKPAGDSKAKSENNSKTVE
jgi:large subunit ribosomal protein L21